MDPLKLGSLFTGIGGFDLAADLEGYELKFQVEIDEPCQQLLAHHWPDVPKFRDIRDVDGRTLGAVDVLVGGFPCQDLSVAGRRAGLAGERSGLWYEFHRLIREIKPRWVVIENVPGLLSSHDGLDFAIVLGALAGVLPQVPDGGWKTAGIIRGVEYNAAWRVLDSQFFGVPQRRRRVFLVASFGDGSCAQILFEPESLPWDSSPREKARSRSAARLASRAGEGFTAPSGGGALDGVAGTLAANAGGLNRPAGNCNEPDFCVPVSHQVRTVNKGTVDGDTYLPVGYRMQAFGEYEDDDSASALKARDHKDATDLVATGSLFPNQPDDGVICALSARDAKGVGQQNAQNNQLIAFDFAAQGTDRTDIHRKNEQAQLTAGRPDAVAYTVHGEHSTAMEGNGDAAVAFETDRARCLDTTGGYAANQGGTVVADQADPAAIAWHENKGGQLSDDTIAKALRAGASHSYQGVGVRRLTPVECERLQGFPDQWTAQAFGVPFIDRTRYHMLGNAVTVNVVRWLLHRIKLKYMDLESCIRDL